MGTYTDFTWGTLPERGKEQWKTREKFTIYDFGIDD